jgi:hypothetical protein
MVGDRNTSRPVRRINPDAVMVGVLAVGFVLFVVILFATVVWWKALIAMALFFLFVSAG